MRNFLTESIFGPLDRIPYGWDYTFVLFYLQFETNLIHLSGVVALLLNNVDWLSNGLWAFESDWFLTDILFWIF
jgi:hypothetical protein